MNPELGQLALCLAWAVALFQAIWPMLGTYRNHERLVAMASPLAIAQFIFVSIAFAILIQAFITNDFSVVYVASHSNSLLPWYYRFSAVWGGHEGSLLLWSLILNIWTLAVVVFTRAVPRIFYARVISILGIISLGFLSFILLTSNPFDRHWPALSEGQDLNPLLQDIGLILHPPMLYTGYVGFAVAFAFAVASLLEAKLDAALVRWTRPWTLAAWSFLTLGIALGSWWAYYELGWGGWWFWDPVENASFMPWLIGTALIHTQAATEKRGSFRAWTLLLSIFAFSLSLLGTFLVRSGVLTSVHAFASDPTRGLFVLIFLGLVTGGALLLYAIRAPKLTGDIENGFGPISRETLLMINNLLLSSACAMVLLGTLYPLAADAMGWGKVSVGPPYFGLLFFILVVPIVFFVPFAPYTRWQREDLRGLFRNAWPWLIGSILITLFVGIVYKSMPVKALFGLLGGSWVILGTLLYLWRQLSDRSRRATFFGARLGMCLAHLGIGVFVVGVLVAESTSVEKDVRLTPGMTTSIEHYEVIFERVEHEQGPNYVADRGVFLIKQDGLEITRLYPSKRLYQVSRNIMTEAAIDAGLTRDLYISMGESMGQGDAWAVRIYYKPLIRWIWLGALFMALGGLVALSDKRYHTPKTIKSAVSGQRIMPMLNET
jgi:cytochrome c-type biogenesis protein CcmF